MQKVSVSPQQEAIVYSTISGGIGVLMPFTNNEDAVLCTNVQRFLNMENISIVGRSHASFRSYFYPVKVGYICRSFCNFVKGAVDGDLFPVFFKLPLSKQLSIATEVKKPLPELLKKIEEIRSKLP